MGPGSRDPRGVLRCSSVIVPFSLRSLLLSVRCHNPLRCPPAPGPSLAGLGPALTNRGWGDAAQLRAQARGWQAPRGRREPGPDREGGGCAGQGGPAGRRTALRAQRRQWSHPCPAPCAERYGQAPPPAPPGLPTPLGRAWGGPDADTPSSSVCTRHLEFCGRSPFLSCHSRQCGLPGPRCLTRGAGPCSSVGAPWTRPLGRHFPPCGPGRFCRLGLACPGRPPASGPE